MGRSPSFETITTMIPRSILETRFINARTSFLSIPVKYPENTDDMSPKENERHIIINDNLYSRPLPCAICGIKKSKFSTTTAIVIKDSNTLIKDSNRALDITASNSDSFSVNLASDVYRPTAIWLPNPSRLIKIPDCKIRDQTENCSRERLDNIKGDIIIPNITLEKPLMIFATEFFNSRLKPLINALPIEF